ncbi:MAG: VWA domain-containing protein [Verrucomicrobiia bacterium]
MNWQLENPIWLLLGLALWLVAYLRSQRGTSALLVPFAARWYRPSLVSFSRWPEFLAYAGLGLLVVALARPQHIVDQREVRREGYDLMLVIDLSKSMWAEDFQRGGRRINRLEAIRPVIEAFIRRRPNDRIGMVVFSGRAYTLAPLTFDHDWLQRQTDRLRIGMVEDGTAIGDGLGVALSRLEQSKRQEGVKRKGAFIILLTDGANNRGSLAPDQAADLAQQRGIPVYAIGAGRDGIIPMPFFDADGNLLGLRPSQSDLDEPTLRMVAQVTGGNYFRAYDADTISGAFDAIDAAKKIEFQAKSYRLTEELFMWFAVPGLVCLLVALGLVLREQGFSWRVMRKKEKVAL